MTYFALPRGVGSNVGRPLATAEWADAEAIARFTVLNEREDGATLQIGFFPHPEFMETLDRARLQAAHACQAIRTSSLPSKVKVKRQREVEEAFAALYRAACYRVPYSDDRHCITFAGTRSGKGASSLIPALSHYRGSAIVLDPKGENAIITAERRGQGNPDWCEGMCQRVLVFDPYGVTKGLLPDDMRISFNPLDMLDPESDTFVEDVNVFADALIVPSEGKEDQHFDEMARRFIAAVIFYCFAFPRFDERKKPIRPDLALVRKYLMRGDEDAAEQERRDFAAEKGDDGRIPVIDPIKAMLRFMMADPEFANGAMANDAGALLNTGDREFGGIVTTTARATAFIDSKMMQRALKSSDFHPDQIKSALAGMTLYICMPPRFKATAAPCMRLLLTCCLTSFQMDLAPPANGRPILFLLEEFGALGRMKIIEDALGYAAGFGVMLWPVLQDYPQLERLYGKGASSFIGNAGLVEFFGTGDKDTAKLCSDMLGETEISRQTVNINVAESSNATTPSEQQQLRAVAGGGPIRTAFGLLTAMAADPRGQQEGVSRTSASSEGLHIVPLLRGDEVKALAARAEYSKIAIPNGGAPMFLQRLDYYRDPRLAGRFRPLPHHEEQAQRYQSAIDLLSYDDPAAAVARANAAYAALLGCIAVSLEE